MQVHRVEQPAAGVLNPQIWVSPTAGFASSMVYFAVTTSVQAWGPKVQVPTSFFFIRIVTTFSFPVTARSMMKLATRGRPAYCR